MLKPSASLQTITTVKMLAIIEQWEGKSGCHTDNNKQYLLLILFKLGLDVAVLYSCCRKLNASFLNMCSLSIVLADMVMAFFMVTVCFFGPERSLMPTCFLLAYASATYAALPLPMMLLGLLDYYLEDTCIGNQRAFCKFLRNVVLTLLVWIVAGIYSVSSVHSELMEVEYMTGTRALGCEVDESILITYFVLAIFAAVIIAMVPFWSKIPQWVQEVDRLSEAREKQGNQKSDLFSTSMPCDETKRGEENYLEGPLQPRPPLWLSLTLGFSTFWMPYLTVTVACTVFGLGVPAYISVNLLWLECTNSLMVGAIFWAKSKVLGPYSHLPENVCLWHLYWHLSRGTQHPHQPSQGKRDSSLCLIEMCYLSDLTGNSK